MQSWGQSSVRGTCEQARASRITPNERATASGLSPSGCSAAPAVSFGAFRAACQMRVPWDRPRETETARNPSPSGCLVAKTVALGAFRGIRGAAVPQVEPRETESPSGPSPSGPSTPRVSWNASRANARHLRLLPRGVSRHRPSPSGRFAPLARCGCRGTRRGRRKLPRTRRPWAVSRRKPSPSGRSAASAGRPRPKIGRGPASR